MQLLIFTSIVYGFPNSLYAKLERKKAGENFNFLKAQEELRTAEVKGVGPDDHPTSNEARN